MIQCPARPSSQLNVRFWLARRAKSNATGNQIFGRILERRQANANASPQKTDGAQWNMCEVDEATLTAGLQPVFMLAVLSRMSHTAVDWASGYILSQEVAT